MVTKRDVLPLLPRSGTIDAIHGAQEFLDRLEDSLKRELQALAAELDRARTSIKEAEDSRDGWKARALAAEQALAAYQQPDPGPALRALEEAKGREGT